MPKIKISARTLNCRLCGEEFSTYHKTQVHCERCVVKKRRPSITCRMCGKIIKNPTVRQKNHIECMTKRYGKQILDRYSINRTKGITETSKKVVKCKICNKLMTKNGIVYTCPTDDQHMIMAKEV